MSGWDTGSKDERNQEIFYLYTVEDASFSEMARKYGLSASRVKQICRLQKDRNLKTRLVEDLAEARWIYQKEMRLALDDAEIRYRQEINIAMARFERGTVYTKPKMKEAL